MGMAELSREHTVSELRTLRTNFRGRLEVAVAVRDGINQKVLVYQGQQSRRTERDPDIDHRLTGLKEALQVAEAQVEMISAAIQKLDDEYRKVPKYNRKKKGGAVPQG